MMRTTPRRKVTIKFKVGDYCMVHAQSDILKSYFEEHGQPIDEFSISVACFEGRCTSENCDSTTRKKTWVISINALVHNKNGFTINEDNFDEFFFIGVAEPDNWTEYTRKAMVGLEKKNSLSRPHTKNIAANKSTVNLQDNASVSTEDVATPEAVLSSRNEDIPATITDDIVQATQLDLDINGNNSSVTEELDSFIETYVSSSNNNDVRIEDEEKTWMDLNRRLEVQYGLHKTLTTKPSNEDYTTVCNFIADSKIEDYKELGHLWLEKFNVYNDNEKQKAPPKLRNPIPRQAKYTSSSSKDITSNDVDEGNAQVEAHNQTTPLLPPVNVSRQNSVAHIDLTMLSSDIPTVPPLRQNAEKFNHLKVSYNELEQFFKEASKDTKFENLYDLLCTLACNALYTESGRYLLTYNSL